jgi:hypothetical protein
LLRKMPWAAREEQFQTTKKACEFLWQWPETLFKRSREGSE